MPANMLLIGAGFVATILIYCFAYIVIKSNPKSWKNRSLFAYLFVKGIAFLMNTLIPITSQPDSVIAFCDIYTYSILFFAPFLFMFGLSFYLNDKKMKNVFFGLITIAIITTVVYSSLAGSCVAEPAPYGWNFDFSDPIGGGIYYMGFELAGIILLLVFAMRISTSALRRNMLIITAAFFVHLFTCITIIFSGRAIGTAEFDPYWTLTDIILFGIALRYFLKIGK